ncbi:MAG TPA: VOC family protein [Baekduia sp.]|nr:VOC family protein [Baekduia sp.]
MARRTTYTPGTFCAVDLVTPDREGAKAFYAAVLSWTAEDLDHGYTAFRRDGALVAGAVALTPELQAAGSPPAWSVYVRVESLDAALARVVELGGAPRGEPFTIPVAGRGAAIADPQGAVLLLWEPDAFEGAEVVNESGAWAWNDLQTPDPEAAVPFYEGLFGWELTPVAESGDMYWSLANDGRTIGGFMRSAQSPHPYWTVYFGVDDVDDTLERVAAAGGRTLLEPVAVPAGRFTVALDPQGAVVCFVEGDFDD